MYERISTQDHPVYEHFAQPLYGINYKENHKESWYLPDHITEDEIYRKNNYLRPSCNSKCYFGIVNDRFLITFFVSSDETYEPRNAIHSKLEIPVFNLNSFGLKDYDVFEQFSQLPKFYDDSKKSDYSLSQNFSDKFDAIYDSHKIYEKIFNLGMREEDKIPVELIAKLDSHQHSMGPTFKRFIFYALKYYNPDFYRCNLFEGVPLNKDKYYQTEDFSDILIKLYCDDYKILQPLCTKHRYIFYLTAKRVFNFEGLYSEYQKDSKIYPFISHLSHNCKLEQPISALAKLLTLSCRWGSNLTQFNFKNSKKRTQFR